jgi:transposase
MAVRPTGARWAVANADAGMATLVARRQAVQPPLLVFEATGGSQRAVVAAVAAPGLPGAGRPPRQVRALATATGQLATTDALAARALAPGAEAVRPPPRPVPDAQAAARRALLARRGHWSPGSSPFFPVKSVSGRGASPGSDVPRAQVRWHEGLVEPS